MYGQSGRGLMYNFYININCKALDGPKWNRSDIASRSGSRCDVTHTEILLDKSKLPALI